VLREHVHDQVDHHFLVLGQGLRHQEGQCRQAHVVDHRLASPEQSPVAVEEIDQQEGTNTLVAVGKGMILDDKVEEVGCLGLNGRIGWFSEQALIEIAEQAGKSISPVTAEQFGCLPARHQVLLEPPDGSRGLGNSRQ
jgi:hypothetical protein